LIYSATFLFCLIIAPLLANLRGRKPDVLFFAVAGVYAVFGAVSLAIILIVLSQVRETEPAYHDTYYVVSNGNLPWSIGIAMAVFGAITWTQTRFGAMRHPVLTKILFWVLHVALIGSTSFQMGLVFILPKPRRYIDYPEFMEIYALISIWSGHLSQAALIGLFCLLLWSVTTKWLAR
jgi:heme/copper-type cytochrome/quinol oxidase subunit 1